ncbi:MAG: hypothetical protein QOE33_3240, partial [Acidobacteriota bacterium]|nr:hypothetical protein [Acidobacteriota bacterium]
MPARKLEGYVAASVLFIDIVGFSLLLLDEQHQQLEILQSIAQSTDAFKKAGNKVTPAPAGDGFALAFFNGYVPPLLCAIEISHALKGHSEIKVRMGLSQGPVKKIMDMSGRPNVSGDGIIDSQRVMDFGEAGHILVSKNLAAILLRMKDWESKLHYLGEARDKHNIIHYIYNYHDGEVGNRSIPKKLAAPTKPAAASPVTPPSISPAGKPPRKVPMFLPLPSFDADTFVRRDAELERLETCLIKGDNKVCCISVGDIPGGIGKTTLAHVFASKHKADFPDGIISVRVGKKSERELAQEFVSYCHSEERPHDAADATALMRRTFGDRRMLLIFDNAEESHNIRDLLPGGDKCAVIITTRRRDLGGALSIPLGNEIALGVFDDAQAKDLLGRLIGPERVREESAAADKIIKALSRLPLAIRIAGTTLQRGTAKYKTLNQYADDLRNKENILARHGSSSDPNLSLNASITLSLVALDNDEYTKFFLRLSACSEEGFSLTEALAANNYNENETDEVGKVMERLFDFALV